MENEIKKKFDEGRKKNIKKYILWGALALLVLALAVMPLLAKTEVEEDGPVASVLSGTVETGSITTSLKGGGNLTAENAEDVTIPATVKITEFLVNNGDNVAEGDVVATVDKVSVMTTIVEVTESMEYLQEQIEAYRNETVSSSVKATAGGRIKHVYAEAGDDVQEVMMEHGALAVLSLDSLMAVQIQRSMDVGTGDSVWVTLEDGTEVEGRVDSNLDGVMTITIEDEGYEPGQKVIVTSDEGGRIGMGELYIHSQWKATAFTGTISTVYAKEENTAYSGTTLFTLTDTEFTAQMEYMSTQHREYEELLQELMQMYETGVITAPCDGVISGVDKDSAHLLAAEEGEYQVELLTADTAEKGWTIMLLSDVPETPVCTGNSTCTLPADSLAHEEGCIMACDRSDTCDATVHHSDCIKACDKAVATGVCDATVHYKECIESCVSADEEGECKASPNHKADCIESCTISDGSTECAATGTHHAACIKSCDMTENCPGTKNHYDTCVTLCTGGTTCPAINHKSDCALYGLTYKAYAAEVTAAGEALVVMADISTVYTVTANAESGYVLDQELRTDLMLYETTITPTNTVSCNVGDIILIMAGYDELGNVVVENRVVVYRASEASSDSTTGGGSGMPTGGASATRGAAGMSGASGAATTQTLFDLEGDVLMTVTPRSTVSVTIAVDEQDISKVYLGQTAEVQVEAIKGETFEAVVTQIATTGANNGGSSKFDVDLQLEMTEDMLDGMSATASIPLYTKMDVLRIPVAALAEEDGKTVVYTALDKETGDPTSPVVVEVGVSDGEYAEIISGLSSGDTYYYTYYDTLELSTAVESSRGLLIGR